MLYLRDEFFQHPKFATWTKAERWDLLELMGYLSRYNSGGLVPKNRSLLPRNVTSKTISKAIKTGWIDVDEYGNERFHDWESHNDPKPKDPTGARRQARWRERHNERNAVTCNGESNDASNGESNASPSRAGAANPIQRTTPSSPLGDSKGSTTTEPPTTPQQAASSAQVEFKESFEPCVVCERVKGEAALFAGQWWCEECFESYWQREDAALEAQG